ncbi:MAG: hypothetical protein ABSD58_15020 [Verrucomicrobiia bacterium]|jgi:F0F1-type ATP synthase assembly protein I
MAMTNSYKWRFFRAGGFDQVKLDRGADLAHLDELDQKLWVALACPTRGIEFDTKTLDLVDTDKDGRIRAPEIIAAAKWAAGCLKNPDDLLKSSPALPLTAINDATPEGKTLLSSARQILSDLGKKNATEITVEDTADTTKIFSQTNFNGDGIIPVDAASDDATKTVITDIINCLGAETDRSGKPGINQAKLDQFFADAAAYSDWWKTADGDVNVLPLRDTTPAAATALASVKAKIDDYFARCRLAAFDARSLGALNRDEKEYLVLGTKDLTTGSAEVAGFPLARIEADRPLPLKAGVNPAWAGALTQFQTQVVKPLIGDKAVLTEADWAIVSGKFAGYDAWAASKAGASVEKLAVKRVREILSSKAKDTIAALIAKDKALEPEFNSISAVDRLTRYYRDLHKLLVNFVSFRDFYGRQAKAVFQAGTLYLDQRSCELCIRVEDIAKHSLMAALSGSYLAYCECTRKSTGETMTIAAAFTDGDSDNLMVGRNGIFYDRAGCDWDATIVKLIDNPISLRQAFWSPYKKLVRMIEEQVAKRAAVADAATNTQLAQTAVQAANAEKATTAAATQQAKRFDVGTVAALGVAFGSLATAFGIIFAKLADVSPWKVIFIVLALILVISVPAVIIAALKLRKRNLGPLLDANGWAVNAKARINIPFGASLTEVATLPPGAQRDLTDPFAESHAGRNKFIVLLVVLGILGSMWYFGCVLNYLPQGLQDALPKSGYVLRKEKREADAKAKAAVAVVPALTPAPAPAPPLVPAAQ